jgi:hypothetical protein
MCHSRPSIFGLKLSGQRGKAIVGLRPSFSSHVRWGEHGAPVRFPPTLPATHTPAGLSFKMVSSHAGSLAHSVSIHSARLRSHFENGIEIPLAFRRKPDSRTSGFSPTPQVRHKRRSIRLRCAVVRRCGLLAGACAGSPVIRRSCVPRFRLCTGAF